MADSEKIRVTNIELHARMVTHHQMHGDHYHNLATQLAPVGQAALINVLPEYQAHFAAFWDDYVALLHQQGEAHYTLSQHHQLAADSYGAVEVENNTIAQGDG